MKFLLTVLIFLFVAFPPQLAVAQEGVIHYEVSHDLRRGQGKEMVPSSWPERYMSKYVVYFTPQASLYKRNISQQEEWQMNGGAQAGLPQFEVYLQPGAKKRVMVNYFDDQKYITEHVMGTVPWKIEDETRTILGYACQKATFLGQEPGQNMTAWFTKSLRPALGPLMFYTLPGAVLEIDVNSGESIFTATSVDLKPLKKKNVAEPRNGKKVTEAQYNAIIKDYWKQLQQPGGNIKIKLN